MQEVFTVSVNKDVKEKFDMALKLKSETPEDALEALMLRYAAETFQSTARNILQSVPSSAELSTGAGVGYEAIKDEIEGNLPEILAPTLFAHKFKGKPMKDFDDEALKQLKEETKQTIENAKKQGIGTDEWVLSLVEPEKLGKLVGKFAPKKEMGMVM